MEAAIEAAIEPAIEAGWSTRRAPYVDIAGSVACIDTAIDLSGGAPCIAQNACPRAVSRASGGMMMIAAIP